MRKRGIVIHPEELTEQMIETLGHTDLNVLGLHPVGGPGAEKSLEEFLEVFGSAGFQEKVGRIREMGMQIEFEVHALSWMLPRELYESHPEWFREDREGKRTHDFNMCASNQEALEYLSVRAAELATALKPDTGRYYFWIDDIEDSFCHCEKCRRISPSDQALILYHAILDGIRQVDREAKQCYLAYLETMEVPTIAPREGIFLEYAPMYRDPHRPMNDEACEKNRQYHKSIRPLLVYFGKKDSQVLDYWLDNSLLSEWKKPPKEIHINEEAIREDIGFYEECGFEGVTTFGCYLSDDYIALHGRPPIEAYAGCFGA
jgi:hypothetical protein|nr:DUF4838 domain-containing protein [uncultured Acetatifactor sp.]